MDESGGHREMMEVLGNTLMAMLNKYWIYICAGMFFFVSFEGRIVMYKIIYMMLLLFCVACYQVLLLWAYCTFLSGWLCAGFSSSPGLMHHSGPSFGSVLLNQVHSTYTTSVLLECTKKYGNVCTHCCRLLWIRASAVD